MSRDDELPAFIRRNFRSVWALEVMLLIQAHPDRPWRVDEVVTELRTSRSIALSSLDGFERAGLAVREEGEIYRFAPANALTAEICQRVAQAYRERPVAVINLIAAPEDRLQQLADAFPIQVIALMFAPALVYLLCLVTSAACAGLLARAYSRDRSRLLLWTSLGFCALALNNLLLVIDLVVLPGAELWVLRQLLTGAAIMLLLHGLLWEAEP